jgi:hypothetical protein
LDIIVVDSTNDELYVLPGYGNGSFPTISTYDGILASSTFGVAVVDFNNNNQSDIVVANYGTNNVLVLIDYSMKPSARQMIHHVGPSGSAISVAISDLNNDHILDIVSCAAPYISILYGLDNGSFSEQITYLCGDNCSPQYICVGDLNNDNQMDIIVANFVFGNVGVFLGYGNGTFADMMTYSTGTGS